MFRFVKAAAVVIAVVILVVAAFFAWQWPFTTNLVRTLTTPPGSPVNPNTAKVYPALEKVAGASKRLPGDGPTEDRTRFADAIKYAEDMKSYSFLIWRDGELLVERYMNGGTVSTRTESASMHKSVMAMVVGHALADGKLGSLEDPVGKYIDEWEDDERGKITLRQVLNMATGLTTTSAAGGVLSETSRFQMGLFPESILLSRKLQRPPGTVFEYLNVNSNTMGLILSRVLGMRYADYLSLKIWKPLGADDAFVWPDRPGGLVKTSGSLLAAPRDWLRLGIMLEGDGVFDDRQVLPQGWVQQMITPSPRNPNYGLQIWLGSPHVAKRYYNESQSGAMVPAAEPFLAEDTFFFDGFGGQRVYVVPSENLVIVRTGPARLDWDDSAVPNMVVKTLRAERQR
jgi:CubicO group peptidase (beta-lactamase class C family)